MVKLKEGDCTKVLSNVVHGLTSASTRNLLERQILDPYLKLNLELGPKKSHFNLLSR